MAWLPDWVTGFDREAHEKGLEADRKNQELTARMRDEGRISEDDFRASQENFARSVEDPDAAINAATAEGFQDGIDNVRGFAGDVLALPFKLIPPIGWLLIIGAVLFYMGGWAKLGGILNKGRR